MHRMTSLLLIDGSIVTGEILGSVSPPSLLRRRPTSQEEGGGPVLHQE